MQKSMSLKYEPASEPLHIYVKQLFICAPLHRPRFFELLERAFNSPGCRRPAGRLHPTPHHPYHTPHTPHPTPYFCIKRG